MAPISDETEDGLWQWLYDVSFVHKLEYIRCAEQRKRQHLSKLNERLHTYRTNQTDRIDMA